MLEKDRIQNLKFHIKSEDYFGTLATVLDLFRLDVFDRNKILKGIIKNLVYLQDNYKIIKKN
ncbi:hypothetical protein KAI65_05400 [Candidatus Parcubacteria bacterium]|nr:hypothetical protein [Candidatus Parcubacteria bacterium]